MLQAVINGHPNRCLEDSGTEGSMTRGPVQEVSVRNKKSNLARDNSCMFRQRMSLS